MGIRTNGIRQTAGSVHSTAILQYRAAYGTKKSNIIAVYPAVKRSEDNTALNNLSLCLPKLAKSDPVVLYIQII